MELFQDSEKFVILNGQHSLWCNRLDARLQPRFGANLGDAWSLKCRGIIYGVIGKIQFFPGADWRLLVISKRTLLGSLPGNHQVYRIDRVAVLTLSSNESPEADLDFCEQHQSGGRSRRLLGVGGWGLGAERESNQQKGLGQAWSKIKTAAANMKEKNVKDRELKDKEKLERRFVEELLKMFNDSESFYYSPTGDLTNSLQRQFSGKHSPMDPLWKKCDTRFLWNKFMMKDLLNSEDLHATKWILPIIQGYCKIEHCINRFEDNDVEEGGDKKTAPFPPEEFDLVLISRRSVYRAGTRYRRRGVDEDGYVANYVETEQIVCTATHDVAFVQVRGSVPVYWSQPGYKYRPPPRLDQGREETLMAFKKHFDHQLELYKSVAVISLVDQSGREKIISDAFMDNILAYDSPFLSYITFDFHEYCRGMKFENVSVLVERILDVIKDVRYCWTDAKGIICGQRGVFRVNCMDCLDRTNVVQAALARHIVEQQLKKLGKLLPDQILPASIRMSFQEMWASNGDAISRQYAGTAALKGDFTRTGERRFTGVMKDGYNSANRYYLNRFKATYRQTLIDMMLGNAVTEDISALIAAMKNGTEEEQWTMEREECVVQLVQHCKQLLVGDEQECRCGWALVDPFYSPDGEVSQDQDVILLLTNHDYYVASYDDEVERITQYEQIGLEDLEKIEIGLVGTLKSKHLFIRIYRKYKGNSGFFHTLRTIQHRTAEDAKSVLLCIADEFAAARANMGLGLRVEECRLDKKKSKSPPCLTHISSKSCLSGWPKRCSSQTDVEPAAEHKAGDPSFASYHRTRFQGLRTSFSDTCLVQRRLEDVANELKTSTSAPQSCSSSSGSDEDNDSGDTEDMEHCIPTITANPLEGSVGQGNSASAVNEEINSNTEVYSGREGERHEHEETSFTNEEQDKSADIKFEEEESSEGCEFVLGSGTDEDKQPEVTLVTENNKEASEKGGDSTIEAENRAQLVVEGSVEKADVHEEPKKDEEVGMIGELQNGESHFENGNDNNVGSKLASTEHKLNCHKQENRAGGSFKLHEDDLEIKFHGTVASLRVSQSSGELSTMASSRVEDTSEVSPEKRRFGARFLNRAPGNRVPRMNIFASAHARGRTLIPDLRSKLSSISQQVRSRSPRLNAERPGLHSELNNEQKQRKGKCQTRFIEL